MWLWVHLDDYGGHRWSGLRLRCQESKDLAQESGALIADDLRAPVCARRVAHSIASRAIE